MSTNTKNPFLHPPHLKNDAFDFAGLRAEHYLPALDSAIVKAREALAVIRAQENPTFANTIEALETATEEVDLVASVYYNLLSAEGTEGLQKIADQFGPRLAAFSSDLTLDEMIFNRVKAVFDSASNSPSMQDSRERLKLLTNTYEDFVRNGALLDATRKNRLREIDEELSKLSPKFSENLLKATNSFELHLTSPSEIAGLPDSALEAAAHEAESRKKTGWVFTLQGPSYVAFLTYADRRDLRERMWRALSTRCTTGENDNRDLILRTVRLRHERARLLGFKTHADFVLRKRMAETSDRVLGFLDELLRPSLTKAREELREIEQLAQSISHPLPVMPWDWAFLSEKLKLKKYAFDQEQLRPYFQLEKVIAGVFKHAELLFDLEFRPAKDYPTYHPEVDVFEVYRRSNRSLVGLLYTDFFPRPTKRDGAWMANFHEQGLYRGQVMRPHVSITCNFTKSTREKPSLLTLQEVLTLFHEFGHALHSLLSQCRYQCLSGTNVYWDFVELPSQLMENWVYESDALDLFAEHYSTGESIPTDLTRKIKESSQFMAGSMSLRQLNFGFLDMAWHAHPNPEEILDVMSFEQAATEKTRLLPHVPGTSSSCGFGHIFAGGYSAGYYSYKWAEVLDADAFEFFKERGLFDKNVADRYRENILERGGTEHPAELYRKFRGRDPDPKALLRREGML